MAIDIDKLRQEDRQPVAAVVNFLRSSGLEVELVGPANDGIHRYNDAALLAVGQYDAVVRALTGLGSMDGPSTCPAFCTDYKVSCVSRASCEYSGEIVRCKYSIQHGTTGMEIGFKVTGKAMQGRLDRAISGHDGQLLIPFGPAYHPGVDPNAKTRVVRKDAAQDIARSLLDADSREAERRHAEAVADLYDNEEGGSSTFPWERDDPDAVGC